MASQKVVAFGTGVPHDPSVMITAAANNAEWCASMCRAHDLTTTTDERVWRSPTRTPLYYPDAVTLSPSATAEEVLAGIDVSPGCSVKDSFASLDLEPHGFAPLFDAEWISRTSGLPIPEVDGLAWSAVDDAIGLAEWEAAWSDGDSPGLFTAPLLADPDVRVIAGRDVTGGVRAGAVLNRSATVIGVSNVFGAWPGVVRMAAEVFGELPLVGYESGEDLDDALAQGFARLGSLRVWLRH